MDEFKKIPKKETEIIEGQRYRGRTKWKNFYPVAETLDVGESIRVSDYVPNGSKEYGQINQLVHTGLKKTWPKKKFSVLSRITGIYIVRKS